MIFPKPEQPRWEMTQERTVGYLGLPSAPTFLPTGIDRTGWIDITKITDRFRVFLAPNGKVHDGAAYYALYEKELLNSNTKV